MLISEPDAATEHWITIVPPLVCKVAKATGEALPVALVSAVIALAVAVPLDAAPNAVEDSDRVATAVPGDDTVEGEMRNTSLPLVLISAVTASVAAFLAAVLCVTAILKLLQLFFVQKADQFDFLDFSSFFASDLKFEPQFTRLPAQIAHAKNLSL
jgi:hypothetical protein